MVHLAPPPHSCSPHVNFAILTATTWLPTATRLFECRLWRERDLLPVHAPLIPAFPAKDRPDGDPGAAAGLRLSPAGRGTHAKALTMRTRRVGERRGRGGGSFSGNGRNSPGRNRKPPTPPPSGPAVSETKL